ncbi:MAG: C39 family peptidase [Clostridium sp.]
MNKQLRKITTFLLTGVIVSSSLLTSAYADTNETPAFSNPPEIVELSDEEQRENDEKLKLAEEYAIRKELTRGYGSRKVVPMSPVAQEKGYWCGPAAAYCATRGANSQANFATLLGTTKNGTNFSSAWKTVLNNFLPGNNYTLMSASNYSNWRSKLKDSIIYTIDKGYPVIADCHITSNSDTWLCNGYSYATNTWHYVTVAGYDDLPNTNPAQVYIGDSNTASGISRRYWTSLDKLKAATSDMGIIW